MTAIDAAVKRRDEAFEQWRQSNDRYLSAEAELFRLSVLEIADKYPDLTAVEFEITSEYDDEGGYFDTVSLYARDGSGGVHNDIDEMVENELLDARPSAEGATFIQRSLAIAPSKDAFEVTVKQLKEVSW